MAVQRAYAKNANLFIPLIIPAIVKWQTRDWLWRCGRRLFSFLFDWLIDVLIAAFDDGIMTTSDIVIPISSID